MIASSAARRVPPVQLVDMTTVDAHQRILPGSPEWKDLLSSIGSGSRDRDLNDENPFDQVAAAQARGLRHPATSSRASVARD